jgi:hypothetical protein
MRTNKFLLLAALACLILGVALAAPAAEYGAPVHYALGRDIVFPDFTMRFLGRRHVESPVFKAGFTYYDFAVAGHGKTRTISWTSGTGLIDATDFEVDGRPYELELRGSVGSKRWLGDNEMVVWRRADYLTALEKSRSRR